MPIGESVSWLYTTFCIINLPAYKQLMTSIASLRIAVLMVIQKNSNCPSTARIFHAKKDLNKVMVRQCQPEVQHSPLA